MHYTNTLNNLLSYKELPNEAKKELVLAKDQHEKLILNYEKQLEDYVNECSTIKMDNELFTHRIECMNNDLLQVETNGDK